MLCQNCGVKNAVSIYTVNKSLKYLCGECYKNETSEKELDELARGVTNKIKICPKCTACGTSFSEFEKTNLFGCEECYVAFKEHIVQNFLPNFKEQKYLGKKPNVYYIRQDIKNLEQLIEICLKNGNFQKATIYGKELEKLKAENYDKLQ